MTFYHNAEKAGAVGAFLYTMILYLPTARLSDNSIDIYMNKYKAIVNIRLRPLSSAVL